MNRVVLQPTFVLHRYPYQNTSLIVELFSLNHGRIAAVARSARGPKSRYKGLLQPFIIMLASWSGKNELKFLGDIELNTAPLLLEGNALMSAFYLNELLLRLLQRDDPHPNLFLLYQNTLSALADFSEKTQSSLDLQIILRKFEKNLLDELGYGLSLMREAHCDTPIDPEKKYRYIPEHGFTFCADATAEQSVFLGKSLIALQKEDLHDQETLREAKRLMRLLLGGHLGKKPLKSRELMQ